MKKKALLAGVAATLCILVCVFVILERKQKEEPLPFAFETTALKSSDASEMEVYFFQAGKADATLLTTENYTVLIDCGLKGFGSTILEHLKEKNIDHIDYLIITHFDKDHVGGAAEVIQGIPIGMVLQNNSPKDSSHYERYVTALANAGIEPVTVTEDYSFDLDGVSFAIDPADTDYAGEDESNNSSLLVTVVNGGDVFLFMGDAETDRIAEYINGETIDCDVLKVAHHGKKEKLMNQFLDVTKPELAVITSSDEELEAESTVTALEDAGADVLLTREGDILMVSDGTEITVH